MRLVSVYYKDIYPFHNLPFINSFIHSNDPEVLAKGDAIVVWGGGDIHPSLYSKPVSRLSWVGEKPTQRDVIEWAMMQRAKELGLPIIGVCRGAQMLCALAGGHLIQHVNGHGGYHTVVTNKNTAFETNSIHHQMMVPGKAEHTVLAEIPNESLLSDEYWDGNEKVDHHQEPEFIHFNSVNGFGVQWHPEMMPEDSKATQFVLSEIGARLGN